ncbi:hypothetical protein M431DRAFT_510307 [Trichoderma harzianum CBS 226.95]|uniref:Uncharacterized protein n=1 Tax=Trichoderma harzianum CBS 226.95 TaxID=983964 RepID=A0A2T4A4V1_TRIHA|nr:hypothetical protein M431DRAFT_510307 [Trichoderma harzianum CBS 226.95]PTB52102.1 hypothetical protein M431DRAFT_510307 [Trichoderma harzianum CBS 226.95]
MPTIEEELTVALKAQYDLDNRPDITNDAVNEIKNSIIFQYNWEELLQSGPVALTSIGSCFIACTSKGSDHIQLDPLEGKEFQYIKHKSLNANLMDSANYGCEAFLKAERSMLFVKQVSGRVSKGVADVVDILMDEQAAKTQLASRLIMIKVAADDCYDKVKEIDEKFERWLLHCMELHAACMQTQSTNAERLSTTERNMAVAQAFFDKKKTTVDETREITQNFAKQVEAATETFKRASDAYPSGWGILGQQIVGSLVETATTAVRLTVKAFAFGLSPVASSVDMFHNLVHGGENAPPNPPTSSAPKPTEPPHAEDLANLYILKSIPYFEQLNAILTKGKNGGVNWADASGKDGRAAQSSYYVKSMLQSEFDDFRTVASRMNPSQTLLSAFVVALKIATAIHEIVEKSARIGLNFPEANSQEVKDWQQQWLPVYLSLHKLLATARSQPGTAASGLPIMAGTEDPAITIGKTKTLTAAQASLDAAKYRLSTTQKHLSATQDLYQKSSQKMIEQQNKLSKIQADIKRLSTTTADLNEVKRILIRAIELIAQMKSQIANLCRFFGAIGATVDAVVKYNVQPFIDDITATTNDPTARQSSIAGYNYTDLTRTMIYQAVVTIQAYFSVFADIASMWSELSREDIMPGLTLVDMMSLPQNNEEQQLKMDELQNWTQKAQDHITQVAAKKRAEIIDQMGVRIKNIEATTKMLPPAPAVEAAIEEGTQAAAQAGEDKITHNDAASPLKRFSMKT